MSTTRSPAGPSPADRRRVRRLGAAVVAVFSAVAVAGCASSSGSEGAPVSEPTLVRAQGVVRAEPGGTSTTALGAGITAFGHDLYGVVAGAPGKNIVYSPLSIEVALAMARAGARGTTAAQIDAALHLPAADRDATMNALLLGLSTQDTAPPIESAPASTAAGGAVGGSPSAPRPPILTIANGLFVAQDQQIGAPFLRTMAADYGAGVRPVDFASPAAVAQINAWVKKQTAGRIDKLFDSLDPSTRLVLADAIYLRADWAQPFEKSRTRKRAFTRPDGGSVEAQMMRQTATFRYLGTDAYQAIELPYADSSLTMVVMLPTGDTPLGQLLLPKTLSAVEATAASVTVDLSLPRWDFATKLDLVPTLKTLGVRDAFGAGADFSGIYPGLLINKAVHRANISVGERGTEAAAATGLAMVASGVVAQPQIVTMDVDHPFAFAILDKSSDAVVFEGSVADPTAG